MPDPILMHEPDSENEIGSGLFFAAHDPTGRIKTFVHDPHPTTCWFYFDCPNDLVLTVLADNAGMPGFRVWKSAFETVIGVFNGDWWDASTIYRNWALSHAPWTVGAKLLDRIQNGNNVPNWYINNHIWFNTGWFVEFHHSFFNAVIYPLQSIGQLMTCLMLRKEILLLCLIR